MIRLASEGGGRGDLAIVWGDMRLELDVIRHCNARHVLKRVTGEDGVYWPDRGEESMIFVDWRHIRAQMLRAWCQFWRNFASISAQVRLSAHAGSNLQQYARKGVEQ